MSKSINNFSTSIKSIDGTNDQKRGLQQPSSGLVKKTELVKKNDNLNTSGFGMASKKIV